MTTFISDEQRRKNQQRLLDAIRWEASLQDAQRLSLGLMRAEVERRTGTSLEDVLETMEVLGRAVRPVDGARGKWLLQVCRILREWLPRS